MERPKQGGLLGALIRGTTVLRRPRVENLHGVALTCRQRATVCRDSHGVFRSETQRHLRPYRRPLPHLPQAARVQQLRTCSCQGSLGSRPFASACPRRRKRAQESAPGMHFLQSLEAASNHDIGEGRTWTNASAHVTSQEGPGAESSNVDGGSNRGGDRDGARARWECLGRRRWWPCRIYLARRVGEASVAAHCFGRCARARWGRISRRYEWHRCRACVWVTCLASMDHAKLQSCPLG